jgi:hypothetical protein
MIALTLWKSRGMYHCGGWQAIDEVKCASRNLSDMELAGVAKFHVHTVLQLMNNAAWYEAFAAYAMIVVV